MSKTITRDKAEALLAIQTPRQKQTAAIERALIALEAASVIGGGGGYAVFAGAARELREAFYLPALATTTV